MASLSIYIHRPSLQSTQKKEGRKGAQTLKKTRQKAASSQSEIGPIVWGNTGFYGSARQASCGDSPAEQPSQAVLGQAPGHETPTTVVQGCIAS
jgi:hypothetical protein